MWVTHQSGISSLSTHVRTVTTSSRPCNCTCFSRSSANLTSFIATVYLTFATPSLTRSNNGLSTVISVSTSLRFSSTVPQLLSTDSTRGLSITTSPYATIPPSNAITTSTATPDFHPRAIDS